MTAVARIERTVIATLRWRIHLLALAAVSTAILLLFYRDVAGVVTVWVESSTFNHCLLIPPIIAWMVSQRLPELRQLQPQAWWPGLLLIGAGALAWLVGEAGSLALARHAGLIAMLQGAAIACLGKAVARALAFPIFYALFLIPAGEELVPPMQRLTAEICMLLLNLAGIPAHIEGIFISIPNGYFEVAEACAGVKFLIAMIALGALVANLCFRSWKRRLLFMIAAVAVPILANGARAWATVYVAHLTNADAAAGFDHVVYGGIFFAVVLVVMFGIGWPFFDRDPREPWFDPTILQPRPPAPSPILPVAASALALVLVAGSWSSVVAASSVQPLPSRIELPAVPGWQRVPAAGRPWRPHFAGADFVRVAHYRNAAGRVVTLAVAVFTRQQEGRELVGFEQGAVGPESQWAWTGYGRPPPGGRLDRIASHGDVREVASFYRVGDVLTGSAAAVKLETVKVRLLGGPQRAVAILVSAEAPAEGVSPRPTIDSFLAALGPVEELADRAAGLPQG